MDIKYDIIKNFDCTGKRMSIVRFEHGVHVMDETELEKIKKLYAQKEMKDSK